MIIGSTWGGCENSRVCGCVGPAEEGHASTRLSTLATNAARQLHVLGHDRDALGVDGAEVRVLKEADEVRLARLLQRGDGRRLEAQVGLEVLRDLAHEALERQLADQQLRRLLVAANLAQRHRARAEAVRLLLAARASAHRRRIAARRRAAAP